MRSGWGVQHRFARCTFYGEGLSVEPSLLETLDRSDASIAQFSILNPQSSMTLHAALHSQGAQDGGDHSGHYLKNLFDGVPFEVHNSECFNF